MPNCTEAPFNHLRESIPELKIQGPTELPAAWLYGETITLTATGGDGEYYLWATTAPENVSIKTTNFEASCEATIKGLGAAEIIALSHGKVATYQWPQGNQPLLKSMDNTRRNYLEAEAYCQQAGGSLMPESTWEILEAILKSTDNPRKPEIIAWAIKTFKESDEDRLVVWLKDEAHLDPENRPVLFLKTGDVYNRVTSDNLYFTICQFNPSTLDQAVASWVPNDGEATPGDRFTPSQFSSQQSSDLPQLPYY
jgi:hypothetical protein